MRSTALSALFLAGVANLAAAQSIAVCPAPPGGQLVCESHQTAVCEVRNGKVSARCFVYVGAIKLDEAVGQRLVLEHVIGDPAEVTNLSSGEVRTIYEAGRWEGKDRKIVFQLPKESPDNSAPLNFED